MKLGDHLNKKIKNYLIVTVIYLITILAVLYIVFLYKKSNNIANYDSDMNMYVLNISDDNYEKLYNNINNYIVEKNNFVIYVSSDGYVSTNLKKIIIEYNLNKEFLYINTDNVKNINKLIKDFSENQFSPIEKNDATIIYFLNGKIIDITPCTNKSQDELTRYFKKMGMI